MIERVCLQCNVAFFAEARDVNRGRAKFCSKKCSGKHSHKFRLRVEKEHNCICAYCNVSFYRTKSKFILSRSGLMFCSRECKDKAQRIGGVKAIHPSHYGEELADYRSAVFKQRGIKVCEKCGWDEHIEILQVHHKDRNRQNNKLENLEILCPNCHLWDHYQNKDGLYGKLNGGACSKAGESHLQ